MRCRTQQLERALLFVFGFGVLFVLSLSYAGVRAVYTRHIVQSAVENSVRVADFLLAEHRRLLIDVAMDNRERLAVTGNRQTLDQRLKSLFKPFDIIKVKVFDRDGLIVYSTDTEIIGKIDAGNRRLMNALGGKIDAKLERKGTFIDMNAESLMDVNLVETYIPIFSQSKGILGAFEVYVDVSKYDSEISSGTNLTIAVLSIILILVSLPAVFIIRSNTANLRRAQADLNRLATIDSLTGVATRGHVLARGEAEFFRWRRSSAAGGKKALGVILLDLDHFKHVNDTHGHPVGDVVLQEVAQRISGALRQYDLVGRYGGEEFLVFLPETEPAGIREVAERILAAIRRRPIPTSVGELTVTASLGYTNVRASEDGCAAAIKRADDGLYSAKAAGRDQAQTVA